MEGSGYFRSVISANPVLAMSFQLRAGPAQVRRHDLTDDQARPPALYRRLCRYDREGDGQAVSEPLEMRIDVC